MVAQSGTTKLLREGHAAFNDRDRDRLFEKIADDVTWHSPGNGPTSGTFQGQDNLWEDFFGVAWEAPMRIEDQEMLGTDEHATAKSEIVVDLGDEEKRWALLEVVRVADGKIAERWAFFDRQAELDAFIEQMAQQVGAPAS